MGEFQILLLRRSPNLAGNPAVVGRRNLSSGNSFDRKTDKTVDEIELLASATAIDCKK